MKMKLNMRPRIFILLWISLQISAGATSDCNKAVYKLIPGHTACLKRGSKVTPVEVTPAIKKILVDGHNKRRANVNPPATNMLKMRWDDDMAMLARRWAEAENSFKIEDGLSHDPGIKRFIAGKWETGQNIWYSSGKPEDDMWEGAMGAWWAEEEYYSYETTKKLPEFEDKPIGHYTQMAWGETYLLGCAAAYIEGDGKTHSTGTILVCNYAPTGNWIDTRPYTNGTQASACKTKSDGLCDCGSTKCHYGTLRSNCTCDCTMSKTSFDYYRDGDCALICSGKGAKDNWMCTHKKHGTYFGNCKATYGLKWCPHLCNVCPVGDINYVEKPDTNKAGSSSSKEGGDSAGSSGSNEGGDSAGSSSSNEGGDSAGSSSSNEADKPSNKPGVQRVKEDGRRTDDSSTGFAFQASGAAVLVVVVAAAAAAELIRF